MWWFLLAACGGSGPVLETISGAKMVGTGEDDLWRLASNNQPIGDRTVFAEYGDSSGFGAPFAIGDLAFGNAHADGPGAIVIPSFTSTVGVYTLTRITADGAIEELPPPPAMSPDALGGGALFAARDGIYWAMDAEAATASRYDGSTWQAHAAPPTFGAIFPIGDDELWVMDSFGTLEGVYTFARWDGDAWTSTELTLSYDYVDEQVTTITSGGDLYSLPYGRTSLLHCGVDECAARPIDFGNAGFVDGTVLTPTDFDTIVGLLPWEGGVALVTLYTKMGGEFDKSVTRVFEAWPLDPAAPALRRRVTIGRYDERCDAGCPELLTTPIQVLDDGTGLVAISMGTAVLRGRP